MAKKPLKNKEIAVAKKTAPTKKAVAKKTAPTKKAVAKKTAPSQQKSYGGDAQFLASIKPYALKKNEKYMNAKQRKHFLSILESWHTQLQFEQD